MAHNPIEVFYMEGSVQGLLALEPVLGKWQGSLDFTSSSRGDKQNISVLAQMVSGTCASHSIPNFILLAQLHGLSMTATWQMLSVPALFSFCITYKFGLHGRAVLISQSFTNHCILFKYAYYYSSWGCVMTGVLRVAKGFLVAYGAMCAWYTFPDVNSCRSSLYSLYSVAPALLPDSAQHF